MATAALAPTLSTIAGYAFTTALSISFQVVTEAALSIISPVKNVASYLFPIINTYPRYSHINKETFHDDLQMPHWRKERIYNQLEVIKKAASLNRPVRLYSKPDTDFSSFGGSLSISSPVITLTHEQIFPSGGALQHNLFSDQQIDFLVSRQVVAIKENHNLIKSIIKVAIGALILSLYFFCPFSFLASLGIILVANLVYLYVARRLERRQDIKAISLLETLYGREEALKVAKTTLEKARDHNIAKRANFKEWALLTKDGNKRFDAEIPTFGDRIRRIKNLTV